MINKIKQYWFFGLLIIVAGLLFYLKYFVKPSTVTPTINNPKTTSIPGIKRTDMSLGQVNLNIQFNSAALSTFPKNAVQYEINKLTRNDILNIANPILKDLSITTALKAETINKINYLIWKTGSNYFRMNTGSGQILFSGQINLKKGDLTPDQAEQLVKEKLIKWGLINLQATTLLQGYGSSGLQMIPVEDATTADIYRIYVQPFVNGIPIYGLNQRPLIEVKITKTGDLLYLSDILHSRNENSGKTLVLKSYEEIVSSLPTQGQIVGMTDQEGNEITFPLKSSSQTLTFTDVSLNYIDEINPVNSYTPVYLLSGKLSMSDGSNLSVIFSLPAGKI